MGSSWGFDLLCLLGVRHSGEVGERDLLCGFLVCLMIMRFLPTLRFSRSFIILGEPSIVSIIFPDDDWRGPQVLDLPRGVHLRSPRHLPGHHQHLHVPPQVQHHHYLGLIWLMVIFLGLLVQQGQTKEAQRGEEETQRASSAKYICYLFA